MNTIKPVCLAVSLLSLWGTAGCHRDAGGGGATGGIAASGGGFSCGPALVCNPAGQYCFVVLGGPAGTPPGHSCVDVPGRPTCASIPIGIGCACVEEGGGVTVTCTAP